MVNLNPNANTVYYMESHDKSSFYYMEWPKPTPRIDRSVPIESEDSIEFPEQQSNSIPPFLRIDYYAMKIIIPEKDPRVIGDPIPETEPEKCLAQREEYKNAEWIRDLETDTENVKLAKKIAKSCCHKEHDSYIDPKEHYKLSRRCLNEISNLQSEAEWCSIVSLCKADQTDVDNRMIHAAAVAFFEKQRYIAELNSEKSPFDNLYISQDKNKFVYGMSVGIKKSNVMRNHVIKAVAVSIFVLFASRFPKLCALLVSPYIIYQTVSYLNNKFNHHQKPKELEYEQFKFLYIGKSDHDNQSRIRDISDVRS